MAPEVRRLPPRVLSVLLLATLPILAAPTQPAKTQPSEAGGGKTETVEAQARLLQELDRQIEERRRELARQEEELSALKRALEAAKQDLLGEKDRLEGLKREVEAAIAQKGRVADQRLDQIAKVYAAMKPKEAALAMEKMVDDTAVGILERLPNRVVGKLFDAMSKERVRELTRRLEEGRPTRGAK
jgi:flagellar motility protein MotE (MotC chaperone)